MHCQFDLDILGKIRDLHCSMDIDIQCPHDEIISRIVRPLNNDVLICIDQMQVLQAHSAEL